MDVKWFKDQQKKAGVTAEDIASLRGRARANVSHIYAGHQRMSLEWAQAFAEALKVPVDEVLKRAGVLDERQPPVVMPEFAEGDAEPWDGSRHETIRMQAMERAMGGEKPGVDVWTVRTSAMVLGGYLPGDHILVDTGKAELCKPGDVVIAQRYNARAGTAETVLRRFEPPVLVAASAEAEFQRALVVDGDNVAIRGKVIASWRLGG